MKLTPEQKAFYDYGKAVETLETRIERIRNNARIRFKWNITSCHSNFAEAYGTTLSCTMLSVTSAGSGPRAGRGCL